jgi:hypothetical protein
VTKAAFFAKDRVTAWAVSVERREMLRDHVSHATFVSAFCIFQILRC